MLAKKLQLCGSRWSTCYASLVVVICVLTAACSQRRPIRILVEHWESASLQIYSAYPDGSHRTQLAEFPVGSFYWVSPDGKRLAVFVRADLDDPELAPALTLIDMSTGTVAEQIESVGHTQSEGNLAFHENLAWSPDGTMFAFLKDSAGKHGTDVSIYDLGNHRITDLTSDDSVERAPAWSPDGQWIAFATLEVCGQSSWSCSPEEANWKIMIMKPDGSDRQVVADFGVNELYVEEDVRAEFIGQLCNLLWSPDSKYIAFENDCRDFDPPIYKEVFVASVDGARLLQLTSLSDPLLAETLMSYSIQWSSSGDRLFIGYSKMPYGPPSPTQMPKEGIIVVSMKDLTSFDVDSLPGMSGSTARWSLDGDFLTWSQLNSQGPRTVMVNRLEANRIVTSGVSTQLPDSACSAFFTGPIFPIQWSPDGTYLAYTLATQQGIYDDCKIGNSRGIAVVTIPDGRVVDVAQALGGDNRLIGWFPAN